MELLRLLPWRKGTTMYDGLPAKRLMLRIWLLVMFLEDMPQLAIQVAVLTMVGTGGVLAPLSIAFSVSAIVWRSFRKVIYLLPSSLSVAIVSGADTPQQPACSATGASAEPGAPPPAYDHHNLAIDSSRPNSRQWLGLQAVSEEEARSQVRATHLKCAGVKLTCEGSLTAAPVLDGACKASE